MPEIPYASTLLCQYLHWAVGLQGSNFEAGEEGGGGVGLVVAPWPQSLVGDQGSVVIWD
jgi:hypothetical protein